jgi:hypothetical protein
LEWEVGLDKGAIGRGEIGEKGVECLGDEVVFIAVVEIEGVAIDLGALGDVTHGDLGEVSLRRQRENRLVQEATRSTNPEILRGA